MKYFQKITKACLDLPVSVLLSFGITFNVAAQNNDLFEYLPVPEMRQSQTTAMRDKAFYPIQINREMSTLGVGDQISLPLPDGRSLRLKINKKWSTRNGDEQIVGYFEKNGTAIITFGKNSVFANFSNEEHNFGIGFDENRQPFLIDHKASGNTVDLGDDMRFPETGDTALKKNHSSLIYADVAMASEENPSVVTLLAVYSPQFASGFVNPVTRINQMIAFTNEAYARSGVHIELQLAHAQQITFNNSANIGTLLDQATDGTGAFLNLHALRDRYFADMVAVLPFTTGNSVAGVAWVNGN